jgi:hypothetical protein
VQALASWQAKSKASDGADYGTALRAAEKHQQAVVSKAQESKATR